MDGWWHFYCPSRRGWSPPAGAVQSVQLEAPSRATACILAFGTGDGYGRYLWGRGPLQKMHYPWTLRTSMDTNKSARVLAIPLDLSKYLFTSLWILL